MSRGGRGGGRGGRGGNQGTGIFNKPWESEHPADVRPSELFPPRELPTAAPLNDLEIEQIDGFLDFRRHFHDSPLYVAKRTPNENALKRKKFHNDEQRIAFYKSEGGPNPFTAVERFADRFNPSERDLPDFSTRPFCSELFPPELRRTFEGSDLDPAEARKRRRLVAKGKGKKPHRILRLLTDLPDDDEDGTSSTPGANATRDRKEQDGDRDGGDNEEEDEEEEDAPVLDEKGKKRLFEEMDKLDVDDQDEDEDLEEEPDLDKNDEDIEYDDEDAGDYDAELYFDGGEDDDLGDDGGGDDGVY